MYGDIMNLDGWAGQGMSIEVFRHKVNVLKQHCEEVGRDPAEIKLTVLMPLLISDDKEKVENFNQRLGPESMAGSRNYLVDRIGEFIAEGVDEIMFGSIPVGDVEAFQQVEEEIIAVF